MKVYNGMFGLGGWCMVSYSCLYKYTAPCAKIYRVQIIQEGGNIININKRVRTYIPILFVRKKQEYN